MKKLLLIVAITILSGCSTIKNLWDAYPRDHDPVMLSQLVSVKIAVEKLNCDDKNWTDAENKIQHLKIYSELRSDPQAKSISQLETAVVKAKESDKKLFCESVIKVQKTRINVITEAWGGR